MDNKTMSLRSKLNRIQIDLKAPKNLYNSFGKYKYRNVEGIQEAVKPLLNEYAVTLEISDEIVEVGGRVYVKATATLTNCNSRNGTGEVYDSISVSAYAREAEAKKGMDDAQVTGATSSYARKYALNGLFLLDDTKDVDTEEYQSQSKRGTAKAKAKSDDGLPFEIGDDAPKSYREQLREFCKENNYDPKSIIQICGLNANSTEDDYKATLEYAKQTMG